MCRNATNATANTLPHPSRPAPRSSLPATDTAIIRSPRPVVRENSPPILPTARMIIDCHNHIGADLMFYLRGDFPYAQHLVAMTGEGRALGVDRWVVFPFVLNLSLSIEAMRRGEIVYGGLEKVPYA